MLVLRDVGANLCVCPPQGGHAGPPPPYCSQTAPLPGRQFVRLRRTGDYSGRLHVLSDEAKEAVNKARRILQAVHDASPQDFPKLDDTP